MKSYTLSGPWTLLREEDTALTDYARSIPDQTAYTVSVPHQYDQSKWKLDYAYSRALSRYHGYVWYYRRFEAMPAPADGERYRLEFDRVSYRAEVYLNGKRLGEHRHSEEPFSFDATDAIATDRENLLAVRCFEPVCSCEAIDGIRLDQIPNGFWAGSEDDSPLSPIDSAGGILEEVRLRVVPAVRIEDVFVESNPHTGEVSATLTLINEGDCAQPIDLYVDFSLLKKGVALTSVSESVCAIRGTSTHVLRTVIEHHRPWELDNPTLYLAQCRTSTGASRVVRFGFKELLIDRGFFFLNQKRILLKCAHGLMSAENIIAMKAMGFNAFRSIQQVLPEEILDLCDELGMLIIESPLTAWGMRLHENTQAMIEQSLCNMVRMHRNHVCIGAYYLFNELHNTETLRIGADCLPALRALAPHSLFFLSSGRWDKLYDLGSVSNPHSDQWQALLGQEGNADGLIHTYPSRFHASRNLGMGDLHPYVYLPIDRVARNWFRTAGEDGKPIFISECGIGTQEHADRTYFERLGTMPSDFESVREIKQVWDDMERFLTHYGMENVYPFASDLCRASDRQNGRQRRLMFDLIRSNPKINGFSLTSFGGGNEGTMEGEGVIKESVAYALQDGWAPLRWALFTDEPVLYANEPFSVEAVLCNEDVLAPGTYRAQARIKGRDGIVWRRDFDAVYPENGYGALPPLAASVLKESIALPEGDYVLSFRLLEGGCPFGGELTFSVRAPRRDDLPRSVAVWGICEQTSAFLDAHGIETVDAQTADAPSCVLIGAPTHASANEWEHLLALAKSGSRLVFLNAKLFLSDLASRYLQDIAGEGAAYEATIDWLYHFDSIHIRHPWFDAISDEGILELESLFELYPRLILKNTKKADLTVCASLRADAGQCATSLTVGEYRIGRGRAVLNGFRIEEALGKNPLADQMLLNVCSHYGKP